MTRRLRRELQVFRAYAFVTSLMLVILSAAAFRQAGTPQQKFAEITVERVNVVDANGTLRLVISNKDRMHPGVLDGKTIERPRPVAGLLFFNDRGDEVGGLTFTGQEINGRGQANAGIMFDQFRQDQTIGISYSERDGQRTAGLQVWDRSDTPLSELIEKLNAANRVTDPAKREAAVKAARAGAPPGPRRVFVGKLPDRSATVSLADADGKPRLKMVVDAAGNPRIEFLDSQGTVVARIPAEGAKE
jgi:hypothetical protein